MADTLVVNNWIRGCLWFGQMSTFNVTTFTLTIHRLHLCDQSDDNQHDITAITTGIGRHLPVMQPIGSGFVGIRRSARHSRVAAHLEC